MGAIAPSEVFERLKGVVGFTEEDAANLVSIAPIVRKHGPAITDRFYETLGGVPETAKHLENKVAALKQTHTQWMASLVEGTYGEAYFASRWKIGMTHVRVGLDPHWVEGVMSFIRTAMGEALASEISDPKTLARLHASFVKICDLDLAIINLSYGEDRLDRLTAFTGMKRPLIENIIRIPKKG